MAFSKANLSGNIGAGSGAGKFFKFKDTASTKAQVAAADYFLSIYDVLKVGDAIMCTCSDGSIILFVTASSSTTVTTELLETTTA